MSEPLRIARAQVEEAGAIARLIEPGFARHIAPILGQVGRVAFRLYVTEKALRQRLAEGSIGFCARQSEALVGYAELRGRDGRIGGLDHLTLLFVAVDLHGRGIARGLIEAVSRHLAAARPPVTDLTVNASAYAVPVYHRLGFRPTGEAGEFDGIVATPMRLDL